MKYLDVVGNEIMQGQIVAVASAKYETKIGVAKCLGWSSTYNKYNGIFVSTSVSGNKLCGFTVNKTHSTNVVDVRTVDGIFIIQTPSLETLNKFQHIIDRCIGVPWDREAVKPKADGSKIFHLLTSMKSYYSGYGSNYGEKHGRVETTLGTVFVGVKKYSNADIRVWFSFSSNREITLEYLVSEFNLDPNGLTKRIEELKGSMIK